MFKRRNIMPIPKINRSLADTNINTVIYKNNVVHIYMQHSYNTLILASFDVKTNMLQLTKSCHC